MLNFWIRPKHKTFQLWINSDKEKIIAWQSTREAYGDYSFVPILKNEVLLSCVHLYLFETWCVQFLISNQGTNYVKIMKVIWALELHKRQLFLSPKLISSSSTAFFLQRLVGCDLVLKSLRDLNAACKLSSWERWAKLMSHRDWS